MLTKPATVILSQFITVCHMQFPTFTQHLSPLSRRHSHRVVPLHWDLTVREYYINTANKLGANRYLP